MIMNRREAILASASAMLFAATSARVAAQTPGAQAAGGGTIRFAPHAALRVLDPVTTSAYVTRNHGYLIYDTLFSIDSSYVAKPQMVDRWTASADGLTWDFTLRDGLAFHDGAPVTGEDVIASIKRWWQKDVIGLRLQAAAAEVTAPDPTSFRITLKEPFGVMLDALARASSIPLFIMPKRIADSDPNTMLTDVTGSGPYRFVSEDFRPGANWSYVRNDAYVPRPEPADGLAGGKVPRAARIDTIWFPSPDTAISALQNNELDIIESVSPDRRIMLQGTDMTLVAKASPTVSTIRFNWAQPPFNDLKLRQAVQMIVSQLDYLDIVVGDPEAYEVCGALFGCGTPLATDEGFVAGSQDNIDAAKKLVGDSAYSGEKVVIITPGDIASFSALAPLTQQLLSEIGIDSTIETMEWSAFLERRGRSGPVADGGWNVAHAVFDQIDLTSPLGNLNFDARGTKGYTGFVDDPETEALKVQFQRETDPARQQAIAAQMQKRAYELVFYIPLGTYNQFTALRPEVKDYTNAPVAVLYGADKV